MKQISDAMKQIVGTNLGSISEMKQFCTFLLFEVFTRCKFRFRTIQEVMTVRKTVKLINFCFNFGCLDQLYDERRSEVADSHKRSEIFSDCQKYMMTVRSGVREYCFIRFGPPLPSEKHCTCHTYQLQHMSCHTQLQDMSHLATAHVMSHLATVHVTPSYSTCRTQLQYMSHLTTVHILIPSYSTCHSQLQYMSHLAPVECHTQLQYMSHLATINVTPSYSTVLL